MPGYLPPEPGGPEPDLGAATPPPPPPPAPPPPPQPQHQPPPTYQQQLGWGQQQPPQPQQQWAWQPQPRIPDNGAAMAGFVLSMVAAGLIIISAGLSSIVSIVCAGLGIYYSRQGKQRVERGETPKHESLAKAGFIAGIVTLVVSIVATLAWIAVFVLYATNEDFRDDIDGEMAMLVLDYVAAFLT